MAKRTGPEHQLRIGNPAVIAWQIAGDPSGNWYSAPTRNTPPPYEEWSKISKWYYKPPPKEALKDIPWRYVWCGGYKNVEGADGRKKRQFHHFECKPCHCPPGPQVKALWVEADEIALAGGRGSAKSEVSFMFLAKGDLTLGDHALAATYINSPAYRFLVLRKNSKDLKDYFERAKRFFSLFGGVPTENPMQIKFPSGAFGIFDHVADGDAPEKYQGQEFTRIVWEEATHEANEENYLKILMSCRTPDDVMKAQMMLTANPGGRGAKWFNARFVKVRKPDGELYKPGEYIQYEIVGDDGDVEVKTRVLVTSTVDDNPYLLRKGYDKQLELLKEKRPMLYRRWRLGDFDAVDGQFFEEFREKHIPSDPPEACHVLQCTKEKPEPVRLEGWWPRAIGIDYGYSHASGVTWGCWHPKGQLHLYREIVKTQLGTVALGAEVAKQSLFDLERMPRHHMNIYLSPDCFNRTDEGNSKAEQIARGIGMILGRDTCFVLDFNEDEERMDARAAWDSVRKRQHELERVTHLTIQRANNDRKAGWSLIHDYLRWWRLVDEVQFDPDYARELQMREGALAYHQYKQRCERSASEVVPKLQIWSCCSKFIEFLQNAVEKENDTDDVEKVPGDPLDDIGDAARYLFMGFPFTTNEMPREVYISEHLRKIRETAAGGVSTQALIMAAREAEAKYDSTHHRGGFVIPRRAGPTMWRTTGRIN